MLSYMVNGQLIEDEDLIHLLDIEGDELVKICSQPEYLTGKRLGIALSRFSKIQDRDDFLKAIGIENNVGSFLQVPLCDSYLDLFSMLPQSEWEYILSLPGVNDTLIEAVAEHDTHEIFLEFPRELRYQFLDLRAMREIHWSAYKLAHLIPLFYDDPTEIKELTTFSCFEKVSAQMWETAQRIVLTNNVNTLGFDMRTAACKYFAYSQVEPSRNNVFTHGDDFQDIETLLHVLNHIHVFNWSIIFALPEIERLFEFEFENIEDMEELLDILDDGKRDVFLSRPYILEAVLRGLKPADRFITIVQNDDIQSVVFERMEQNLGNQLFQVIGEYEGTAENLEAFMNVTEEGYARLEAINAKKHGLPMYFVEEESVDSSIFSEDYRNDIEFAFLPMTESTLADTLQTFSPENRWELILDDSAATNCFIDSIASGRGDELFNLLEVLPSSDEVLKNALRVTREGYQQLDQKEGFSEVQYKQFHFFHPACNKKPRPILEKLEQAVKKSGCTLS